MRKFILGVAVAAMTIAMSGTAFAGQWKQDSVGWWYQNDDGSYPVNQWMWIDGNNDYVAEHFAFDANGYMYANTTTPDGQTVNESGAEVAYGHIATTSSSEAAIMNANPVRIVPSAGSTNTGVATKNPETTNGKECAHNWVHAEELGHYDSSNHWVVDEPAYDYCSKCGYMK